MNITANSRRFIVIIITASSAAFASIAATMPAHSVASVTHARAIADPGSPSSPGPLPWT
jgi:hypothetical protein